MRTEKATRLSMIRINAAYVNPRRARSAALFVRQILPSSMKRAALEHVVDRLGDGGRARQTGSLLAQSGFLQRDHLYHGRRLSAPGIGCNIGQLEELTPRMRLPHCPARRAAKTRCGSRWRGSTGEALRTSNQRLSKAISGLSPPMSKRLMSRRFSIAFSGSLGIWLYEGSISNFASL